MATDRASLEAVVAEIAAMETIVPSEADSATRYDWNIPCVSLGEVQGIITRALAEPVGLSEAERKALARCEETAGVGNQYFITADVATLCAFVRRVTEGGK